MARFVNLESELTRAGIHKSVLAGHIGISNSSMSSKFTGATEFKLSEMEKIRDYISRSSYKELTLDYLFTRDPKSKEV